MKKVKIYCRVSTEDQMPDVQIDELRNFANQREFRVVGEYVDKFSGSTKKRSELNAMLD